MSRIKALNKFYRRYEVNLWGRLSLNKNTKTVRFFKKLYKEKVVHRPRVEENKIHKTKNRKLRIIPSHKKLRRFKSKSKVGLNFKSKRGKKRKKSSNSTEKRYKLRRNTLRPQSRFFLYRIDYSDPERRKAKTSFSRELFLLKNKLLRFYSNIKKHQLRRYSNTRIFNLKFKLIRGISSQYLSKYYNRKIFKKLLALDAFFSLVEHRLDILIYRSNLAETIQQSRHLIKYGHVYVNGKVITHCNFLIKNYSLLGLNSIFSERQFKRLKLSLKRKKIALYPPRYIYCDYSLMQSIVVANPSVSSIQFPFKIDLSKWLGLAKHLF